MIALFETTPNRCLVALACAVLAASGCSARPELRVAGQAERAATIADGKRLLEQGRAVDAVAAFRRHMRIEGQDLPSLNGLAIAYGELGRADLAGEMFARALAMAPDDPATLNNIGFAALRRADVQLARRYLEKARARSDGLHEIDGNLERLAWLEAFERRPRTGRPLHRAVPPSPKATQPRSPPATMIDFTALVDPFAQGHDTQ